MSNVRCWLVVGLGIQHSEVSKRSSLSLSLYRPEVPNSRASVICLQPVARPISGTHYGHLTFSSCKKERKRSLKRIEIEFRFPSAGKFNKKAATLAVRAERAVSITILLQTVQFPICSVRVFLAGQQKHRVVCRTGQTLSYPRRS